MSQQKDWSRLTAEERVKHAIFRAYCKHPVIGQLVGAYEHRMADSTTVKLNENLTVKISDVDTACTDGKKIWYQEDFINKCSRDGVVFLILHEVLHNVLSHHVRRGKREPEKANIAMDGAINQILLGEFFGESARGDALRDRFPAPDPIGNGVDRRGLVKVHGCKEEEVKDASFETIYELLPDQKKKPCGGGSKSGPVNGHDLSQALANNRIEEEKSSAQEEINSQIQKLMQVIQACKNIGKLPQSLLKMAEELVEPQVDYRSVLRDFLTKEVVGDYSFAYPSRRQSAMPDNVILPGPGKIPGQGAFAVLFDTSGSIYSEKALIDEMMSEVYGIQRDTESELIVFYVDCEIQKIARFDSSETVRDIADDRVEIKGGGGTDFRCVFEYIEKHGIQVDALIGFTDLAASFPARAPGYPVVWITFEDAEGPFGKTIKIKRQLARKNY